jgi:hypothetical protein
MEQINSIEEIERCELIYTKRENPNSRNGKEQLKLQTEVRWLNNQNKLQQHEISG